MIRIILSAVMLCYAGTALAQSPAQTIVGTWHFSWSHIPFAKLWVHYAEHDGQYELTAALKSSGILRVFKKMKTLTTASGMLTQAGGQTLQLNYKNETESKYTNLRYETDGTLKSRDVQPEDDPNYRPPVALARVEGVANPGDILPRLRAMIGNALAENQSVVILDFYEGTRLMAIRAEITKDVSHVLNETPTKTVRLSLTRTFLGGFTEKEKRKHEAGEPPVYLYLDAESLFPLAMEVEVKLGILRAEWVAEAQ